MSVSPKRSVTWYNCANTVNVMDVVFNLMEPVVNCIAQKMQIKTQLRLFGLYFHLHYRYSYLISLPQRPKQKHTARYI